MPSLYTLRATGTDSPPLLVFITGLVAVLHAMGANPILIDAWGTCLVVTDSVIVPVTLASVLMLYDVQSTAVARVTILGVVGVSVLVLSLQLLLPIHLALPGGFNSLGLPTDSPVGPYTCSRNLARA